MHLPKAIAIFVIQKISLKEFFHKISLKEANYVR